MAETPDVLLITAGRSFLGWTTLRIVRSMTHCTGAFELGATWRVGAFDSAVGIQAGDQAQVIVGAETVITGYVDGIDEEWSATSHELRVHGRDMAADLVDCSAISRTGQWHNQPIEQIVSDLAKPFGVRVRARVSTGKALPSFALQEGETAFDAADRAARIRGLLLVSDADGTLSITRAGEQRAPTDLVLGTNLLNLRVSKDMRDRYSLYTAKGQAPGSDFTNGPQVSQIKAQATDPGVGRYRPLVMTNDQPDIAATLTDRVRWEANVRAARSIELEAQVQGWRHADGLWAPNTLARVVAAGADIDTDFLITEVAYELSESGSTTRLSMTRQDAFTLLPLKAISSGPYFEAPKGAN